MPYDMISRDMDEEIAPFKACAVTRQRFGTLNPHMARPRTLHVA